MKLEAASTPALSWEEQQALLEAARSALIERLLGKEASPTVGTPALASPGMTFVTLRRAGELRGCIGNLEGRLPLLQLVGECAIAAATNDPRFQPIAPEELPNLEISVSVLGRLEKISGPDEIEIGRHGLHISKMGRRGILLPQVATELNLDALAFLELVCRKASLPPGAWKEAAVIRRFTSQIFSAKAQ